MKKKQCFKCGGEKSINEFYVHRQMGDGHLNKCKNCTRKDSRENRLRDVERWNNFDRNRYRTNILRMIKLKYNSMRRRVNGFTDHSKLLGKELLSKDNFIKWAFSENSQKNFIKLYNSWARNNYPRKLSPSIDRIDNSKGYILGNLQWITQQENSKKYNK